MFVPQASLLAVVTQKQVKPFDRRSNLFVPRFGLAVGNVPKDSNFDKATNTLIHIEYNPGFKALHGIHRNG